jgi:hypothetical protein
MSKRKADSVTTAPTPAAAVGDNNVARRGKTPVNPVAATAARLMNNKKKRTKGMIGCIISTNG